MPYHGNDLLKVQDKEIVRKVSFILPEVKDTNVKKLRNTLSPGLSNINASLIKKLNKISELGLMAKRVSVTNSNPAYLNPSENLEDVLGVLNPVHDLRVIVNLTNELNCGSNDVLSNYDISHLIELIFHDETDRIVKVETDLLTKLLVQKKETVFELIEDVLLDISMFHTYIKPRLHNIDIQVRKKFSAFKIEHALLNDLKSSIWKIEGNSSYVSLASTCRSSNKFDFHKYVNIWQNLAQKYEVTHSGNTYFPTILEQLRNHNKFMQLPIRRLLKEIEKLAPGTYFLIRTEHKPDNGNTRKAVLSYFKGSKWYVGKVKILNENKYEKLKDYSSAISIFKIIKK